MVVESPDRSGSPADTGRAEARNPEARNPKARKQAARNRAGPDPGDTGRADAGLAVHIQEGPDQESPDQEDLDRAPQAGPDRVGQSPEVRHPSTAPRRSRARNRAAVPPLGIVRLVFRGWAVSRRHPALGLVRPRAVPTGPPLWTHPTVRAFDRSFSLNLRSCHRPCTTHGRRVRSPKPATGRR